MKRDRTAWYGLAVVAGLAAIGPGVCPGGEPEKGDAPRPLPPEVVQAWREAGAAVGWMKDVPAKATGGYEYWAPWRDQPVPGSVPAFRFPDAKPAALAKLADPGVPFGLDLHCWSGQDAELKEFAGLKSLQSLNVGGALLLTDAGLKHLAGLKNLHGLYLFYAHVTDAGLKDLAPLTELRALDLSHTQVTDAGLKELAAFKNLQALNLGQTAVTDAGLKDLAGLKGLRQLNLQRTKVTATGVGALKKELPACQILIRDD
jgi:hypothetical protein